MLSAYIKFNILKKDQGVYSLILCAPHLLRESYLRPEEVCRWNKQEAKEREQNVVKRSSALVILKVGFPHDCITLSLDISW